MKPLVSICIPTNSRPDIIKETLESILLQNVDETLYEVCISDGSPSNETKEVVEKYFKKFGCIKYRKSNYGNYYNLLEALKMGNGKFLKLHNDYSKFNNGALIDFIKIIEKYSERNAMLFFSFGALKNDKKILEFDSFDKFMNNIVNYSTWASAFCITKKDFEYLISKKIDIEMMFPHTSFLYACTDKKMYIVDDHAYASNVPLKKKGGYNLPETFVDIYLSMTKKLLIDNKISFNTFENIRMIIFKFVAGWYATVKTDESYYFTFENLDKHLSKFYNEKEIKKFYFYHYYYLSKIRFKNIIRLRKLRKILKECVNKYD